MDRERWRNVQDLLAELWPLPEDERPAHLDQHCPDPDLRREVEELLAAGEDADSYLASLAERAGMTSGDEPPADLSGRTVGNYRLIEPLGRGGMGVVYRAERADGAFDHQVAVKLLPMGMTTAEARARFLAERQILADLKHPAIAQLLDGGVTEDGTPYFVMELVEGSAIDDWCDARGLDIEQRLRLMVQVCEAVEAAHRRLVVHRDLKPANIMVADEGGRQDGRPKLLDFGVAKVLSEAGPGLTRTHQAPATPAWAAPEQLAGEPVTTATDSHALGAVLYALLVDVAPYDLEGKSASATLELLQSQPTAPSRRFASLAAPEQARIAHARDTVPGHLRRELAGDLDAILQKALAPEPERRYGSAAALAEDLERYLQGHPVRARPPSTGYQASRFIARHRLGVAATALVAASLVGGLGAALWQAREAAVERDLARAEHQRAEQTAAFLKDLFKASDPDRARGREVTARSLLDQGSFQLRRGLEQTPELRAEMLVLVGDLYRELGELEAARPLLEEGLALAESSGGVEGHVEALRGLAQLDMEEGHHDRALALLGQAEILLQRAGMIPGSEHGSLMTQLLFALSESGKAAAAAQHGREMLHLARSDPHLPAAALYDYLVNTAIAMSIAGEPGPAEALLREAAALEVGADVKPTVSIALHSQLASVLDKRGDAEAALEHSRKALDLSEEIYPPGHTERARKQSNLAVALLSLGRDREAEAVLREALAIYEDIYREAPHPRVASAHNNLGRALQAAGRYAAAEVHLARARELAAELFGVDDPRYAVATGNLGDLQRRLGNYTLAEELLVHNLEVRRSILGPEHRVVGNALALLAELRLDQERPQEALALADEALALFGSIGYDAPRALVATLRRRARALAALQRFEEARTAFSEAIELGERAGDDAGNAWPELLGAYAEFLLERHDPGAPEAFERALDAHRATFGEDHPATARCRELSAAAGAR